MFSLIQVLFICRQNCNPVLLRILVCFSYRLQKRSVEYFHSIDVRFFVAMSKCLVSRTGLTQILIIRIAMISCTSITWHTTHWSERELKRKELRIAKRYRKLSVTKNYLLQAWSFHSMGVKLNICLLLLLVAIISSQGFNLREEDHSKDEKPIAIYRKSSKCVLAFRLFLKWRQD